MDALNQGSTVADRALDLAVAVEVAGFRWVTWDQVALAGAPVGSEEPFLAAPDDLLSHLQTPAEVTVPRKGRGLAGVPNFSRSLDDAVKAAERVGLFRVGGASLSQEVDGTWVVSVPGRSATARGSEAAEAVCRAALDWVRGRMGV